MTEMLMTSWDNQQWQEEKSSELRLKRSSTPQQGVEVATEIGQEAVALCHPSLETTAPKTSSIISLLHCDPMFQPRLWLLGWESWDPKEPAPGEVMSLSPALAHPIPPWKVIFSLSVGARSERG